MNIVAISTLYSEKPALRWLLCESVSAWRRTETLEPSLANSNIPSSPNRQPDTLLSLYAPNVAVYQRNMNMVFPLGTGG